MIKIDLHPDRVTVRQFAWVALAGLPILAIVVLRLCDAFSWTHPALLTTSAVGVAQLVLSLLGSDHLARWIFVGLTLIAFPIGFAVSHVLMAAIYYLLITPIALVFRLMGRDVLGLRPDPQRTSYWIERQANRPPASYFRLY